MMEKTMIASAIAVTVAIVATIPAGLWLVYVADRKRFLGWSLFGSGCLLWLAFWGLVLPT